MTEIDIPSGTEKIMVIAIFGGLAFLMAWNGNVEAASGYATTIAAYFLSRSGT